MPAHKWEKPTGSGTSGAGRVLGVLPAAKAQGLLQGIKVKYREADEGQVLNGCICYAKDFILSGMARGAEILSGNKM